ncbi:TonB-dependent receptor [Aquirufa sp. 2-AUSEE-184A6]|uniref:TonB-dependent receptor n=1 Tax=Aquirufa novilacunae TaxID=3139305 RepID=A0ABW8SYA6_9BACT
MLNVLIIAGALASVGVASRESLVTSPEGMSPEGSSTIHHLPFTSGQYPVVSSGRFAAVASRESLVTSPEGMSPEGSSTIYHSPFTSGQYPVVSSGRFAAVASRESLVTSPEGMSPEGSSTIHHSPFTIQKDSTLADVTISAPKYPEKLDRTGKVVSVISAEMIQANQGKSLGELLQQSVGVAVVGARSAPGTNQEIYVRGANTGHVLLLMDGFPLNDPSHISSVMDWNLINLSNIERIEILKGGQSTLYGSDAMAAVINLVTRKNAKSLQVVLQGGGLGTHQEQISWSTRKGNNSLQIQAQNYTTDGFSSAKIAQGKPEADGFKQQSWGVKWGRDFGKNGNLDFSYSSQLYQGNLDNGPFVDDRDYTSKATSHSFRGQYQVKNWTVRAFQDLIHREFRNDSTDIPANAWSKFGLSSYAGLSQGFEAFVKIPVKENSALLVGSEFRRQKTEQSDLSISDYGPYISPDLSEKQKTQQIVGTYATFQQNGRKIGYELGARWNAQSTFGNYFTYNLNPYWAISQTAKLFVNYYTSFKTPSIYQLASPYGNLNLQPEQGKTFELGVERKFKSWKIRVVGFQNEVNQGIVFQSMDVEPFGKYQNISRQKTQGIEFELSYQTAKLQADFNYTHLKGEMIDRDSTYSSLIRRPSNAWNLSLQYKLHAKWSVGMNNQYVGQRTDYFYDESSYSVQANPMDAYLWTDLSIHYQINKNWKLSGMLKNALNQEILEITGYSGQPRNVQISLLGSF